MSHPTPDTPPYHLLGGETRLKSLVTRFYTLMHSEPEYAGIRKLHPATLEGSTEKLYMFLSGWLGGPPLYMEKHGHPMLRARHLPFAIGEAERDQWMSCMTRAMNEEGIDPQWKIGDTLTWQVAGQDFTAPITSIRRVEWDSMQVNFFVIATPALFEAAPTSFITSFHLPADQGTVMNKVAQRFSNLTIVDMSAILKQAQGVIDQVVKAVQFVFLFALGAGLLVLYSALLSTQDERQQEAALMRALGASRAQILASQRTEFAVLGLISGALAAAGAAGIGYAISEFIFNFPYQVNAWIWIAGPLAGLACVSLNAWAGARAALGHPPLLALREA